MPELPEVETVLRTLEKQMQHPIIKAVKVLYPKIVSDGEVERFCSLLVNETIIDYHRLGKYLIFECKEVYLIVHLRMEGKFYLQYPNEPYDHHVHVLFNLDDGRQLRYHDTRKFGRMYVRSKVVDYHELDVFHNVGLDAFDPALDWKYLYQASRNKTLTIKQFLLNQKYMAGVGNIYADEICFAAGIHPCTKAGKVTKKDMETILNETRRILNGAIRAGGTTIRSYTSSLKVDGRFQLELKVHARQGEKCYVCGNEIEKIQSKGRGTYFCKVCQKRK